MKTVLLGAAVKKVRYPKKVPKQLFKISGKYPIVSQEQNFINGYWDRKENVYSIEKPVVIFGDHTTILKYVDFDFVLGADGIKILEPIDDIDSKYFYYFLKNIDLKHLGYARHYRSLKEKLVRYPESIEEQRRIVKKLDEAFEKINKAIELTQKNLQNSQELFDSRITQVLSTNTSSWIDSKLGDAYDVRDGTHDSPKYQAEGYPLVTSKNLKNHKLDLSNVKLISEKDYLQIKQRSGVSKGDVLLAMIGTIGSPIVITEEPNYAIKNVALFKVPLSQDSYFLKYYLDSQYVKEKMRKEAKGSTQRFVGLGYLRNFPIKLPNLSEQKEIVKEFDQLHIRTQKLQKLYQQKLDNLQELKKSLLDKAFKGKL